MQKSEKDVNLRAFERALWPIVARKVDIESIAGRGCKGLKDLAKTGGARDPPFSCLKQLSSKAGTSANSVFSGTIGTEIFTT